MIQVAVVQMNSNDVVQDNLRQAEVWIAQAAKAGAKLIVLPENFAFMAKNEDQKLLVQEAAQNGPIQTFLSKQAKHHGIWLVGGTLPLSTSNNHKMTASCLVYDPAGKQVSRYDKIHLFDVQIPSTKESYLESKWIEPGNIPVIVESAVGVLGLAVCYDIRFPELFRALSYQGAQLLVVPSAFTYQTGAAHWEVLLRARAIENQCYLLAAAEVGQHPSGRVTYGHSMIIDPWGSILSEILENAGGFAIADIDLTKLSVIRQQFPALAHRKAGL